MKGRSTLPRTKPNCSFWNPVCIVIKLKRKLQALVVTDICVQVYSYIWYICVHVYTIYIHVYTYIPSKKIEWVSNIPHFLTKDIFTEEKEQRRLFLISELQQVPYGNPYCPEHLQLECIALISNSSIGGGSVESGKQRGRFFSFLAMLTAPKKAIALFLDAGRTAVGGCLLL